ncbi:hypothetical protein HK405_015806, partial [Cladochytrium tenue]
IQAPCCGEWFACRFCHDEVSDHAIVRSEVCKMMCMHCSTVQPTGKTCVNPDCGQDVARYFCDDCKLWDDHPDKTIYHCQDCGICRIGQGLGKDYFHCSKCNVCMAISLRGRHRCIERNLESDCPICGEFMFTSTSTVIFMPCGHCIHHRCHAEHTRSSYQCPTCLKSLADMSGYFRRLDAALAAHRMPEEYSSTVALTYCNDCELSSFAPFHFLYHRCALCAGYNTRLVRSAHAATLLQIGGSGGEQPEAAGFEDEHATAAAENLCGADPAAVVAYLNAPILRAARARRDAAAAAAKSAPAGPASLCPPPQQPPQHHRQQRSPAAAIHTAAFHPYAGGVSGAPPARSLHRRAPRGPTSPASHRGDARLLHHHQHFLAHHRHAPSPRHREPGHGPSAATAQNPIYAPASTAVPPPPPPPTLPPPTLVGLPAGEP